MVVVRIISGLGNQMFQYAAGRRLAIKLGVALKLDISSYSEFYKLRSYDLGIFNIKENFATPKEVRQLTNISKNLFVRICYRFLRKQQKPSESYYKEKHFHFDPDVLNLPDDVYLDGYWQSDKYFADIAEIIRQEFSVKTALQAKNQELAALIGSCESVSLHIRRGDYVSNPRTSQMFVTCDLDYYYRCVDHISQTVQHPHFFVFSDDHQWAHDNLKLSFPTMFIDHNEADKAYEDLRLMSLCKHNIIANSSFSWWGAWLNNY
ncbi:MAG: alpha-1,2-fucosyltransferase, partial [Candidatus Hodarchaeota archaeon]